MYSTGMATKSLEFMDYSFCSDDSLYNTPSNKQKKNNELEEINEEDLNEYQTSSYAISPSSDSSITVKSRITSLWNNVKYNWNIYLHKNKTHFERNQPICLLGKFYFDNQHDASPTKLTSLNDYCVIQNDFKNFEQDVYTRLWFTYRKDFQPLNGTYFTSDMGWGCMIRSAQMLLAQGFLMHFLGRDWSLFKTNLHADNVLHREIISWFFDRPSNKSPFGLHRLLDIATQKLGKKVGDWFGPVSVTLMMRDALDKAREFIPLLDYDSICMYVAQDCCIYKQDVLELCQKNTEKFTPVILLVSVRLGGDELNEVYIETLKFFLRMSNCIGIIGGKPKHSLYFIGYQGNKVIYLDPHVCQKTVSTQNDEDLNSFHCCTPSKINFNKLDPSLALGFYCKTREDFENFCEIVKENSLYQSGLKENEKIHPIFSIFNQSYSKSQSFESKLVSIDDFIVSPDRRKSKQMRSNSRRKSYQRNSRRDSTTTIQDIEDFVMINSM